MDFATWPSIYTHMVASPGAISDCALCGGILPRWFCVLPKTSHEVCDVDLTSCWGIWLKLQRTKVIFVSLNWMSCRRRICWSSDVFEREKRGNMNSFTFLEMYFIFFQDACQPCQGSGLDHRRGQVSSARTLWISYFVGSNQRSLSIVIINQS